MMKRESLARGAQHAVKSVSTGTARTHKPPSKKSLREMPEVDFSKARTRKNIYAERVAKEGIFVNKGRPRRLLEVGGTTPRSVRFSEPIWDQVEKQAKRKGLTVHAALREAVIEWLQHGG
jgi:hypothetical protein